jgi:glycosyltransferase involved in cell wall biosynthesis
MSEKPIKAVICCPTYTRPHQACLDAWEAAVPAMEAAGIDHHNVFEVSNPYISGARAAMLRKALDAGADVIVFLDHDVSFDPKDLVTLIQTPGDVVAGFYRYKKPGEPEEYMGALVTDADGKPSGQFAEGTRTLVLAAERIPAGFMKITREAVARFMRAYPHLCYGDPISPHVDLFNHGAHEGVWWGEDMAFSRNWRDCGGEIWVIPDLNLTHHNADEAFPGNYDEFLKRQPGGVNDPARAEQIAA